MTIYYLLLTLCLNTTFPPTCRAINSLTDLSVPDTFPDLQSCYQGANALYQKIRVGSEALQTSQCFKYNGPQSQ